jgi:probable HAF family extracellular repeat protein
VTRNYNCFTLGGAVLLLFLLVRASTMKTFTAERHVGPPPDGHDRRVAPRYVIRDLGPADSRFSYALDVNEHGHVVGYTTPASGLPRALFWTGSDKDAPRAFAEALAWAHGINDAGEVVGRAKLARGLYSAFLYSGDDIHDLGTLGGAMSTAHAINIGGEVVGEAQTAGNAVHAFLFRGGEMEDLGTLGGTDSRALDISDRGQVVGAATTRYGWSDHAFLYGEGSMEDLGTLGGTDSEARAINEAGEVVGWADTAEDAEHAFRWRKGKMEDLGALGGTGSVAEAINDAGPIVGSYTGNRGGATRAFLYLDDTMYDLTSLIPARSGWRLMVAHGINEAGQIAGRGLFQGKPRVFLLTPVTGQRARR